MRQGQHLHRPRLMLQRQRLLNPRSCSRCSGGTNSKQRGRRHPNPSHRCPSSPDNPATADRGSGDSGQHHPGGSACTSGAQA